MFVTRTTSPLGVKVSFVQVTLTSTPFVFEKLWEQTSPKSTVAGVADLVTFHVWLASRVADMLLVRDWGSISLVGLEFVFWPMRLVSPIQAVPRSFSRVDC